MSARSWLRTRSARSAVRSEASRNTQGPTTMARPTIVSRAATVMSRAMAIDPPRNENSTRAVTISPTPAASRAQAAQPPLPSTARIGSIRPVGVEPALALGLVGLPPEQRDADQADEHRPEHRALPEQRLEQQDRAEPERGQRDGRTDIGQPAHPAGSAAAAAGARQSGGLVLEVGVGRQHQPEAGVHHHAQAAEDGGEHEARAHPDHGHSEVPGQTRGDPTDDGVLGVAGGPAHVAHVGGSGGGRHDASIVTQGGRANHAEQPRPTPDPRGGWGGQDQGVPDGVEGPEGTRL